MPNAGLFNKLSFFKKPLTLEQYVKNRLAKGDTVEQIRKDLLDDLDKGGPILGDFKKDFQPTFSNSKRRFRDIGQLARTGISATFMLSVFDSKKQPACPNCLAFANQVKTPEEWEKLGFTVYASNGKRTCKNRCNCMLVSAEAIPIPPDEQDE